jgi:hypothetical protein
MRQTECRTRDSSYAVLSLPKMVEKVEQPNVKERWRLIVGPSMDSSSSSSALMHVILSLFFICVVFEF